MSDVLKANYAFKFKKPLTLLALSAAAIAGNLFNITIFYNLDWLFGSIFVMIAVILYGPLWGTITALIASSCTYFIGGHPYGMLIFTAEAVIVSILQRRRTSHIALCDVMFWIFIGMPLVFLFYHVVMDINHDNTLLLMLKHSVNGIINAVIASMLYNGFQHLRYKKGKRKWSIPFQRVLFEYTCALVLITALFITFYNIRFDIKYIKKDYYESFLSMSESVENMLDVFLQEHVMHLLVMGRYFENYDFALAKGPLFHRELFSMHRLFSHFTDLSVLDGKGGCIATSLGAITHKTKADQRLCQWEGFKSTNNAYVTDVIYLDERPSRASLKPIVRVIVPVIRHSKIVGYMQATLDLSVIRELLKKQTPASEMTITLIDRKGNVIISTNSNIVEGSQWLKYSKQEDLIPLSEGFYRISVTNESRINLMRYPYEPFYVKEATLSEPASWRLVTSLSLKGKIEHINKSNTRYLALLFVLILATFSLSLVLSHLVVMPLEDLVVSTLKIPDRIYSGREVELDYSIIEETNRLAENFI